MSQVASFIADHILGVFLGCLLLVLMLSLVLWQALQHRLASLRLRGASMLRRADRALFAQALLARVPALRRLRSGLAAVGSVLLFDLLLGLLILLAALMVFFTLAEQVGLRRGLAVFDVELARALAGRLEADTLRAFSWLTRLADAQVQYLMGFGVALLLVLRGRILLALSWVAAVGGNGLINRALKAYYQRERPLHEHGWVVESGWSFPSGHASGAVVVYGMLAYVLLRSTPPAWHLPAALTAIALILGIGLSRVVLHVHYLSDVLAAYVSAGAWLMICIATAEWIRLRAAAIRA